MKSLFELFRTKVKEVEHTHVPEKTTSSEKCKYCNGDGWVYAGEGVIEDCHPCKRSGRAK